MPSIVITEQDLTAAISDANNEIVYVPGFANTEYTIKTTSTDERTEGIYTLRYLANKSATQAPTTEAGNQNELYVNTISNATYVYQVSSSETSTTQEFTVTTSTQAFLLQHLAKSITSVTKTVSGSEPETIPSSDYTTETSTQGNTILNLNSAVENCTIDIVYTYMQETGSWTEFQVDAEPYLFPHIHINEPTLVDTLSTFEAYFRSKPYEFKTSNTINVKSIDEDATITFNYSYPNEDLSYYYAKDIIKAGLPVYYESIAEFDANGIADLSTLTPATISNYIVAKADDPTGSWIMDKAEYPIKYITTGAYPAFELDIDGEGTHTAKDYANTLLDLAKDRGDCVFLLDHFNIPERTLNPTDENSIYASVNAFIGDNDNQSSKYGAMFTPYAVYNSDSKNGELEMPGSYGFLLALAKSIKTNATWLAIAGLNRGRVPRIVNLTPYERLSNKIADEYEPRANASAINAITNIKGYGLTIWGNRTLIHNGEDLTASSFLNIRSMVSDVKKQCYIAAKRCMFEQNSDVLWVNFKSMITPLLDRMKSGQGIKDYKIVKVDTDVKAKLKAKILIVPIYALEDIEIEINLVDDIIDVN